MSQDSKERYLAELREKYIMDQKATESAGYIKGKKAGIQEGKIERKKRRRKIGSPKIIKARHIN